MNFTNFSIMVNMNQPKELDLNFLIYYLVCEIILWTIFYYKMKNKRTD